MVLNALLMSAQIGLLSVALILLPAVLLGWVLARHDFRGKSLITGIVNLPMVVPPVATGYLLLALLGKNGVVGSYLADWFGIHLAFSQNAAVIACAIVAFPLLLRPIRLGIEQVNTQMETVARSMGAGRLRTFVQITLPLALPAIVSGCLLAFARSLGEFGATMTFAGNFSAEAQPLSLAIYNTLQTPGSNTQTQVLVLVSVITALVANGAAEALIRQQGHFGNHKCKCGKGTGCHAEPKTKAESVDHSIATDTYTGPPSTSCG
jgi:molybdate transport system permease protein